MFIASLFGCKQKENSKYSTARAAGAINYRPLTPDEKESYKAAVTNMYDSILGEHGFNGSILVAKNGEVLLEDYHGYSNPVTKDTITSSTAFHVASVSKTFTGMAIMRLWEENKLNLDDSLQVFFLNFLIMV